MAHFAEIKDGVVQRVIVADSLEWCESHLGGKWLQTSYNTKGGEHPEGRPLRKNYAGVGFTYDESRDAFVPPKPYASWKLNERSALWEAPKPYPSDGKTYGWDEKSKAWVETRGMGA